MKILVVYYSLTGTTKKVAEALAETLGADLDPVISKKSYKGIFGYIRAGRDSWKSRLPEIEAEKLFPGAYDVVVVGAPVWASHAATPIRRYLEVHAGELKRVALFVTCGGAGDVEALDEMAGLAGAEPEARLALLSEAVKTDAFTADIADFADQLRLKEAA